MANKPEEREKYVAERTTKVFENGEFVEAESYDGIIDLSGLRVLVVDRATQPSAEPITLFDGEDWDVDYKSKEGFSRDTLISNKAYSEIILGNLIKHLAPCVEEIVYVSSEASDSEIAEISKEYSIDVILSLNIMNITYDYFFSGHKETQTTSSGLSSGFGIIPGSYIGTGGSWVQSKRRTQSRATMGYNTSWNLKWLNKDKNIKVVQTYIDDLYYCNLTSHSIGTAIMAVDDFIKLIKYLVKPIK